MKKVKEETHEAFLGYTPDDLVEIYRSHEAVVQARDWDDIEDEVFSNRTKNSTISSWRTLNSSKSILSSGRNYDGHTIVVARSTNSHIEALAQSVVSGSCPRSITNWC